MADTSVLSELKNDVVPHWSARLEKYLPKDDLSGALLITPAQLTRPVEEVSCSNSSTKRIGEKPMMLVGPEMFEDSPTQMTPDFPSPRVQPGRGPAADDKAKGPQTSKMLSAPHGLCRLEAKPEPTKSRFSSITGPTVWYDGESQHMLNDLWTAMNNKRGGLRKEMMMLKRRQQPLMPAGMRRAPMFALPLTASDDEDEEEGDKKKKEGDNTENNDEEDESGEMLKMRLRLEREKMRRMNRRGPPPPSAAAAAGGGAAAGSAAAAGLVFKRSRMGGPPPAPAAADDAATADGKDKFDDEKYRILLEAIDENLDRACKITETAAFIWLKGDAYDKHLRYILANLRDIAARVEQSGFLQKKEEEEKKAAEAAAAAAAVKDEDTVMGPPPPPAPAAQERKSFEVQKRKSDVTMRDAEPLMAAASLASPPPPSAIEKMQQQQQQQRQDAVPVEPVDTPMHGHDSKMVHHEPAVVEVGIEVDDALR